MSYWAPSRRRLLPSAFSDQDCVRPSSSAEFHYQRLPVPELWLVNMTLASLVDGC